MQGRTHMPPNGDAAAAHAVAFRILAISRRLRLPRLASLQRPRKQSVALPVLAHRLPKERLDWQPKRPINTLHGKLEVIARPERGGHASLVPKLQRHREVQLL